MIMLSPQRLGDEFEGNLLDGLKRNAKANMNVGTRVDLDTLVEKNLDEAAKRHQEDATTSKLDEYRKRQQSELLTKCYPNSRSSMIFRGRCITLFFIQ